jgi:hypothetical protein
MDCDQVFMILTRGPFPTGEPWDELVEAHLETCAECWRLAEALRPALEVFQEAVPPAEGRDLPGYWGDARPSAGGVAHLSGAIARTATRANLRQIAHAYSSYQPHALAHGMSTGLLRAIVLASTVTAAVIGLMLLWSN